MKKLFLFGLMVLVLSACGASDNTLAVSGSVDVNANVNETLLTQRNGILYIRNTDGINGFCIAIDSSTVYPDVWVSLSDADSYRTSTYTPDEISNCTQ